MTVSVSMLWAILLAVVLIGCCSWSVSKGWKKTRFKAVLLVANIIAAVSAWALLAGMRFYSESSETVVLFTEAGALTSSTQNDPAVYWRQPERRNSVSTLAELHRRYPAATKLDIQGKGLPFEVFRETPVFDVAFTPSSAKIAGIQTAGWSPVAQVGVESQISGHVVTDDPTDRLTVKLTGFGGVTYSEQSLSEDGRFLLKYRHRNAGRHLMHLNVVDNNGGTLFNEPAAQFVTPSEQTNVLMMLARPRFESGQLKRWLIDSGANVLSSTRLATGVERLESSEGLTGQRLFAAQQLETADLLVIDSSSLQTIDDNTLQRIEAAVSGGLGVLILPDASLLPQQNQRWIKSFSLAARSDELADTARISPGQQEIELTFTDAVASSPESQTIVEANDNALMSVVPYGSGKIAMPWVIDTYLISRVGSGQEYAAWWQPVIYAISKSDQPEIWQETTRLARVGHRLRVCGQYEASIEVTQQLTLPVQRIESQSTRCVDVWPDRPGWLEFAADNNELSLYVYPNDSWRIMQRANLQKDTVAAGFLAKTETAGSNQHRRSIVWFWWWLLIASWAAVWLEQKYRQ